MTHGFCPLRPWRCGAGDPLLLGGKRPYRVRDSPGLRRGLDTLTQALSVPISDDDAAAYRRARKRVLIAKPSTVRADDTMPRDVMVEDLSATGFRFSSDAPIAVGTLISIGLAGAGQASAKIAWRENERHGCVFEPPLTSAQSAATFSHSAGDHAVLSFVADMVVPAPPGVATVRAPRFPARLALLVLVLASALGWAILTLLLRSLPLS